jgi:hypothetical protein
MWTAIIIALVVNDILLWLIWLAYTHKKANQIKVTITAGIPRNKSV